MVFTRSALETADLEVLKEEARKIGVPVSDDRAALIEGIFNQMERIRQGQKAGDAGARKKTSSVSSDKGKESAISAGALQQILTAVMSGMMMQQQELQKQQLALQQELQKQQQQFFVQQQQQFAEMMRRVFEKNEGVAVGTLASAGGAESPREPVDVTPRSSPVNLLNGSHTSATPPGNMIRWIASQIPEFGGSENENILTWVKRVDKVSAIHGASDGITLLAASSRLIKSAKQWYDFQDGPSIESWVGLKTEIVKMFERKTPFYKVMQKVEARK